MTFQIFRGAKGALGGLTHPYPKEREKEGWIERGGRVRVPAEHATFSRHLFVTRLEKVVIVLTQCIALRSTHRSSTLPVFYGRSIIIC